MLKIVFLFLMAGGLPVAIAMAGASLIYLFWEQTTPPFVVIHRMIGGIDSFPLLAVPFFILAGNLMNNAGVTNRIFNFALALVGWLKGGLGHVNVLASVIFAGMSGTAIAEAAGLGTIEIKAMKDNGYSTEFAVGLTAASATLGPIIPPSLPFVIYGMMANVSVGALFLAGILPGGLMAIFMMLTVSWYAHKNGWGSDLKFDWVRFAKALGELALVIGWPLAMWLLVEKAGMPPRATVMAGLVLLFGADRIFRFQAVLPIMTPVLLIGGMTTGVFTPTEGAVAACVWCMVLGLFWYRTLTWKMFVKVCLETVETTSTVLFVGCFLEPTAAITILVPLLVPICQQLGIDLVHFGLVMVLNLMIGLLHPPMGMVLFVLARIAKLSVEKTTMAVLPWLLPLLAALAVITYVPKVVLWLPKMFF